MFTAEVCPAKGKVDLLLGVNYPSLENGYRQIYSDKTRDSVLYIPR